MTQVVETFTYPFYIVIILDDGLVSPDQEQQWYGPS